MILAPSLIGASQGPTGIVILLIAVYLLLVFVLPLSLSAAVSYRSLPLGRSCPHCAGETIRLRARWLRWVALVAPSALHRRWCLECGWEGVVRLSRDVEKQVPAAPVNETPRRTIRETRGRAARRTVDVRWLTVDGVPWRVQLECWQQTGLCYGRLIFVEPSGRLWLDVRPLEGRTDRDVLGQALSLPDRQLASRLRELVSD